MSKILVRRAVLTILVLTFILVVQFISPGKTLKTFAFRPCPVGPHTDVSLVGKDFHLVEEKDPIENNTDTAIPETFSVQDGHTFHIDVNAQTEGQTDIIFEKAKVTLGVTVGASFQSETGVSRTFTAEPHKVLHVQYGTYIDHLYVHSYDQDERCNITNENIQFVDVVETVGTWKASEASL